MANDAVPAEVVELLGRTGVRGVMRVRCRVMEGPDKGKVLNEEKIGKIYFWDALLKTQWRI